MQTVRGFFRRLRVASCVRVCVCVSTVLRTRTFEYLHIFVRRARNSIKNNYRQPATLSDARGDESRGASRTVASPTTNEEKENQKKKTNLSPVCGGRPF